MDLQTARTFFMWCTVCNGALLVFSSVLCTFAGDFVYRVHSRWFPMSREAFTIVVYGFVGLYKVLFITLNLIPFLALSIMA